MSLSLGTTDAGACFALPFETQTTMTGIIGRRGSGKTNTAVDVSEECFAASLPFVVFDPLGVWHGLRSNAAGDGPGLAVTILGGSHGDLPLEEKAGAMIADFIVQRPGWYVLDFSGFESRAAERRFATDFAERLYRAKGKDPSALLLIIDEADTFMPQQVRDGEQRLLGSFEAIARRGRVRGLGMMLITQRPAVINKNVLSQCELIIAHQVTAPHDRDALKAWAQGNATPDQVTTFIDSLASLQVGEAWVWSPAWLGIFERVQVRQRRTFDSSATPKPGEVRIEPTVLAPVDLEDLRTRMAETIERIEADDPKKLRAEITRLTREMQSARVLAAKAAEAIPCDHEELIEQLEDDYRRLWLVVADVHSAAMVQADKLGDAYETFPRPKGLEKPDGLPQGNLEPVRRQPVHQEGDRHPSQPPQRGNRPVLPPSRQAPVAAPASAGAPGDSRLSKAERAILTALAQYAPMSRTKRQVAILTAYSQNGGGFNNAIGSLRSKGFAEGTKDALTATAAGLQALGSFEPLPTGADLLEHWIGQLSKAERTILSALADAWPSAMSKEVLAAETGYEVTGGGFNNALGKLRTLELIERGAPRISDDFFPEGRR